MVLGNIVKTKIDRVARMMHGKVAWRAWMVHRRENLSVGIHQILKLGPPLILPHKNGSELNFPKLFGKCPPSFGYTSKNEKEFNLGR